MEGFLLEIASTCSRLHVVTRLGYRGENLEAVFAPLFGVARRRGRDVFGSVSTDSEIISEALQKNPRHHHQVKEQLYWYKYKLQNSIL